MAPPVFHRVVEYSPLASLAPLERDGTVLYCAGERVAKQRAANTLYCVTADLLRCSAMLMTDQMIDK